MLLTFFWLFCFGSLRVQSELFLFSTMHSFLFLLRSIFNCVYVSWLSLTEVKRVSMQIIQRASAFTSKLKVNDSKSRLHLISNLNMLNISFFVCHMICIAVLKNRTNCKSKQLFVIPTLAQNVCEFCCIIIFYVGFGHVFSNHSIFHHNHSTHLKFHHIMGELCNSKF